MSDFMVRIHNTETNEIIDREMTDDEIVAYQKAQEEAKAKKAQEIEKAAKRAELLERLGLTEDEARVLLG